MLALFVEDVMQSLTKTRKGKNVTKKRRIVAMAPSHISGLVRFRIN